ncbi:MAG: diaminopimelate decarboxylase [Chthoniobacterales bacterium]|nr:diaminopimelate decarboxylase [Chthoniobacterales bacterium]
MHDFSYRDGVLHCEGVALTELAARHGTPLYVYSARTIREHYRRLDAALAGLDHRVCYAMKANSNLAVIDLLAREGAGFDIVSGGELFRVLKAGGRADLCTFAGVGKTREEIEFALQEGVYSFNVESEPELAFINEVAGVMGRKAPVALRVNPDVDAQTHKYISTGKSHNKFGIGIDRILGVYEQAAALPNLELRGIQTHIGSQILETDPFVEALGKLAPIVAELKARHGIKFFSIGGGVGIIYHGTLASGSSDWWESGTDPKRIGFDDYAAAIRPLLEGLGLKILLEPGRSLVGNAGVLLTTVLYVKQTPAKSFIITDAGMNDLIRPALYEGHHEIVPLREPSPETPVRNVDVVGPVCESGDFFAQDRPVADLSPGDGVALLSAGAYGFVMASNYNSRRLPSEILVDGSRAEVVRERQTWDDLVAGEKIPGR